MNSPIDDYINRHEKPDEDDWVECNSCNGVGITEISASTTKLHKCPTCDGVGWLNIYDLMAEGEGIE